MSYIYTDSELKDNVSYRIQNIKKLSKDTQRFINLKAIFKYPIGSTAHCYITGTMQTVPIRALINVKGFVASPVRASNAHGFAVVAQNNLGLPLGRAFINPVSVNDTQAVFDIENKLIKIPLDILCSLVRIEEKVNKEVKKVSKETGISINLVNQLDIPEARLDVLDPLPSFVNKLFPQLNIEDIKDQLKKKEKVWFDYEGNDHPTIAECDKANSVIRHKELTEHVKEIVAMETERQMLLKIKA